MTEARRLLRVAKGRHTCFVHVPREENVIADWLCRTAHYQRRDLEKVLQIVPNLREEGPAPLLLDLSDPDQEPATLV